MSALLKPAMNGVYRLPSDPVLLRDLLPAAGARDVDLRRVRSKRGLLAALARALQFPETFGGNWDALADSLQDLSWLGSAGIVLHLRGYDRFLAAAPDAAATLQVIVTEAAQFWRSRSRLFVVFTEGAGAPLPPPR
ncbi:MAG: barstar family protein [Burkholderiales bacterium]|nr:barstar family protein [Burkholderiales bacterium]